MTVSRPTLTPYRVLVFAATVFTVASWIFLFDNNLISQPDRFQESDYIMTFYVAGHLLATGRESDLYPAPSAESFVGESFARAAHSLLASLPAATTAIYMYSPLVAGIFVPLSYADPNSSLFIWQVLSVLALALSCYLLSRAMNVKFSDSFFLSSLFGPVFITLWGGQLGLVLGLLPLCVGYVLLLGHHSLLAGVVWSVLSLKPQYFPAAAFVALVLSLGNFRIALGLALGVAGFVVANLLLFSPALVSNWLASHRLSDTLFTHAQYGIPAHLITSLPADLLLLLPATVRADLKWPVYAGALFLWGIGFWTCWRVQHGSWDERTKITLTLVIGLFLSSVALPHLLYYDLCVLIPAGFALAAKNDIIPQAIPLRKLALTGWLTISLYLPMFLIIKPRIGMALTLELILLGLLCCLLVRINHPTLSTAA